MGTLRDELGPEFAEVISKITAYAYPASQRKPAPQRDTEDEKINAYLMSPEFREFWHGRLGNTVSNWYFYQRDRPPELLRFDEHPLCHLDPPWAAPNLRPKLDHPGCFDWDDWDDVETKKKKEIQNGIDAALSTSRDFSIYVVNDLMRNGRLWRSQEETKAGWVYVELGEILAYSFEKSFLQQLRKLSPSEPFLKWVQPERADQLKTTADAVWQTVTQQHGTESETPAMVSTVNAWIAKILANEADDYSAWYDKPEKDWFITGRESDQLSVPRLHGLSPADWAHAICLHRRHVTPAESLLGLGRRIRFSVDAEEQYRTRNLIIFPLWVTERFSTPRDTAAYGTERAEPSNAPVLTSPFTAYFVATFHDANVLRECDDLVRALLSVMAYPDIVRFAGEAVAIRNDTYKIRSYGRGLRHDLNPRVTQLEGCLDTVQDAVANDSALMEEIAKARFNLFIIRNIVEEFRDYFYKDAIADYLSLKPMSLRTLVDLAVEFIKEPDLLIDINVNDSLMVTVDSSRIVRVIMNIVMNAKESMKDNLADTFRIDITASQEGDSVRLDISDKGCGIAREDWEKIFTIAPPQKSDHEQGLGLMLSRLIVLAHRERLGVGSIFVKDSCVGRGTTMCLELPRAKS